MTKNLMGTPRPSPIKPSATEAFPGGRTADEVRRLLEVGVSDLMGDDCSCYLNDFTDEWVAFVCWSYSPDSGDGRKVMQVTYTMADDGSITWGTPTEVEQRTIYTPTPVESDDDIEEMGVVESVHEAVDSLRIVEARTESGQRVFRLRLIQAGESRNGRIYPPSVLEAAAPLYNGAKVFNRHRTPVDLATSTTEGIVGQIRNVSWTGSALEGDVHLLPSATHTAELLDASLAAQADGLPLLAGISHDVLAAFRPVQTASGLRQEATQIQTVLSVDVVSDPAAGGAALRAVASMGDPDNCKEQTMPDSINVLQAVEGLTSEQRAQLAASLGVSASTTYGRESLMGRNLIRTAVEAAQLPERAATVLAQRLPESFTEDDLTAAVEAIQAAREAFELDSLTPGVPHVQVTGDELDRKAKAMDAMLAGGPNAVREGAYRSLRHAYLDIEGTPRGIDPLSMDLARAVLRESYHAPVGSSRASESVVTSTFAQILGDSITRRMIAVYNLPGLQSWRLICSSIVPVNDFREQKRDRIGGYGLLPAVAQGAPYQPLTTPDDEEATYTPSKRGGTEDLTLEAITNDDLGALRGIPQRLGRAAAITLYRFVWDILPTNPTCTYDSTALFHSSHSNTASVALSSAGLAARRAAMRKQAAYGNSVEVLGATPRYLAVPPELEELAFQLVTSAVAVPSSGNASNIPNLHQGIEPLVIDYWTDANDWFLIADPASVPTIEVGFLGGQEEPELFVQADPAAAGSHFNADKVTYKIRHIYGGTVLDHRGFQRGVQ